MKSNNIIPRPYPLSTKTIDGLELKSRFSKVFEMKQNGNNIKKIRLTAIEPQLPLCNFEYDKIAGKWMFVQKKDADGNAIKIKGKPISPYIPSAEAIEIVRLAQILQRPILIKGEPGSGKTQLARSVAFEWYGADYKNHFFEWSIKSTSKAIDGLYSFDHLARLRDAQLSKNININNLPDTDMTQYRKFGPMGKAFLTSTAETPAVLLIDEIDKADIDFPNDLLLELDERRFVIPASETGETIEADYPPVIFITSNDERELPEAFLRRCLFMYVKFPENNLTEIIRAHMPDLVEDHPDFIAAAIARFTRLRNDIEKDPADNKRVSTSELLDWLQAYNFDTYAGRSISIDHDKFPLYHQALLKTYAAINREKVIETE